MRLYFEGILKDEETDEVLAKIGAYSMEGFEEDLRRLERKFNEAINEEKDRIKLKAE